MLNEIDEIRKRHDDCEWWISQGRNKYMINGYHEKAHKDRATLLARLDEMEALVSVHIEKPVPDDDPMRAIGERLSELLGEDDFNWIEPKLNGIRYHTKELESHVETLVARLGSRVPAQEPKP